MAQPEVTGRLLFDVLQLLLVHSSPIRRGETNGNKKKEDQAVKESPKSDESTAPQKN